MPISPKRVLAQTALRILHLEGTAQDALETAYTTADLSTVLDGAEVPYSAMRDAVLAVEAELAEVIANDKQNPYRSLLYGRSDDLPSGSEIPIDDDGSVRFIGIFSQVNDSATGQPLTEQPVQVVRRYLRGSYKTAIYNYAMLAGSIIHTRPSVYLEGCVWSRPQALARMDTDSIQLSPLPDSLESTWVARTIAYLAQEGWLSELGGYYAGFADNGIQRLRGRNTDLPVLPTAAATAEPAAN